MFDISFTYLQVFDIAWDSDFTDRYGNITITMQNHNANTVQQLEHRVGSQCERDSHDWLEAAQARCSLQGSFCCLVNFKTLLS